MQVLGIFSVVSIAQYGFLAGVVYLLAGTPFMESFISSTTTYRNPEDAPPSATASQLNSLAYPEPGLYCPEHGYKDVIVLNREPLVVYIEGFVTEKEAQEIVELSEPHFTPSTIWNAGQETLNPKIRNSENAPLPRHHTIKCIEERARKFQGWRPHTFIEKLWSQRYLMGGHYTYHYDWSSATRTSGRVSSFMVYLEANCTGGGTHFPRLSRPKGTEWCNFIECEEKQLQVAGMSPSVRSEAGIVFKPLVGNAVYWENMRPDGTGYLESWHAGLPVLSGSKIGLNIWSWFQDGHVPEVPLEYDS